MEERAPDRRTANRCSTLEALITLLKRLDAMTPPEPNQEGITLWLCACAADMITRNE